MGPDGGVICMGIGLVWEFCLGMEGKFQPMRIFPKFLPELICHHGKIEILMTSGGKGRMFAVKFVKQIQVDLCPIQIVGLFIYCKVGVIENGLILVLMVSNITQEKNVVIGGYPVSAYGFFRRNTVMRQSVPAVLSSARRTVS